MSDSTQQYILKRQPKIEMTDERIYFKLPWGEWWTSRKEHESDFVDIPAIQKQLDRLLLENGAQFHEDYEAFREARPTKMSALEMKEKMEAESRKEFIEEVLAVLFGLENKEDES